MKLYKDVVRRKKDANGEVIPDTEVDLFTDANLITDMGNGLYKIKTNYIFESNDIADSLIGGNASAEGLGDDEGVDVNRKKELDIVSGCKLNQCEHLGFTGKKSMIAYIKKYFKLLEKAVDPEVYANMQKEIPAGVKFLAKNYDELDFYQAEQTEEPDVDGTLMFLHWEDGTTPVFYCIKASVYEEKC